jgi:hypothetical protein
MNIRKDRATEGRGRTTAGKHSRGGHDFASLTNCWRNSIIFPASRSAIVVRAHDSGCSVSASSRGSWENEAVEIVVKTMIPDSSLAEPFASRYVDVMTLSGPELLRLVLQTPRVSERLRRCLQCGFQVLDLGSPRDEPLTCVNCRQGRCERLGVGWWRRAAGRMRRACRQDPTLLPAIKAEWEARHGDVPLPVFPDPFSWLNAVWETVAKRGRSFDARRHHELAHLVDRLSSAGISMNKISVILSTADHVVRERLYDALPAAVRRWLGASFRAELKNLPFVSSKEELLRSVRWAHRQWTEPRARLRGERVRPRLKTRAVRAGWDGGDCL